MKSIVEALEIVKEKYNQYSDPDAYGAFYELCNYIGAIQRKDNAANGRKVFVDMNIVEEYFELQKSGLLVTSVCEATKLPYFRIYYIAMKHQISFEKKFNKLCFRSEEEKNHVIELSRKGRKATGKK